MSGRFIGENIRFMYDLFQTAKHDNKGDLTEEFYSTLKAKAPFIQVYVS